MKKLVKRFVSILMVLCMMFSLAMTASAAGGGDFSDVPSTKWSYKAVSHARSRGYVSGVGGNKFDPYGKLTIGQLSQVIYNMAGRPRYLFGYTEGGIVWTFNGYFTNVSVAGEVRTLADYERWSEWYKSIYPADEYGNPTKTAYVDLKAPDCVEQCVQKFPDSCLNVWTGEGTNDYLSYNSEGKWFTSAFVWSHKMDFIPNNKTAYDLATREDIVDALKSLYDWSSEWFKGGEWVEVQDEDLLRYFNELLAETNGVLPAWKISSTKVEGGKVYGYKTKRGRYEYLKDEYEGVGGLTGWAIENHILAGNGTRNSEGKKVLNLGDNVTREEFAQFLYNYDRNVG